MPKLYTRATWNDEVLSASATYNVSGTAVNLSGVSIDLATPISVTGTALNASRMNNIEVGIDAVDNALLSGTFAPTTAYGTYRLDGRYTASGTTIPYAGYLQEGTALLTYITGTSYRVEAGSLDVNGTLLSFSALTRAGLALASGTVHNVYIGASGTSPFLEESTTAPVWDSAVNYYKKTGDASRRFIGYLQTSTVNTIRKFMNVVSGRSSEIYFIDGDSATSWFPVVNVGSATGSWTSYSLSSLVPVHATHAFTLTKLTLNTSGDEGIVGISPIDLGTSLPNTAPHQVRGRAAANGANIFFGSTWLPILTSQTQYYKLTINSGGPLVVIAVYGSRFLR